MFQSSKNIKKNRGMTYMELIVVLTIFSTMTSIVLFNYDKFQARVDIENLTNDIALKIVEAQKSSFSGKLPLALVSSSWKPSYGIYFDLSNPPGSNKNFIFFTDLDQSQDYSYNGVPDTSFCSSPGGDAECLEKIGITRNDYISDITVFYSDDTSTPNLSNLSITFTRPNSEAIIKSSPALNTNISYAQITISSPSEVTANIKVYQSGRIQVN